jgi:Fe-S-cluster containining protein
MGTLASSSLSLTLFQQAEHWFRRASASLLGAIPCCEGCSTCCVGIFPITRLDVLELQRGLDSLPSLQRGAIVARARAQVTVLESAHPNLRSQPTLDSWDDRVIDGLVEQFSDMPCPALSPDGTCDVYPFRPITCRTMGIPTESDGMVQGACTVQTAVPIIRLPPILRTEEYRLAEHEAVGLSILSRAHSEEYGDELLLPYGFLPKRDLNP